MVKAGVIGEVVAETKKYEFVEGNVYFPPSSIKKKFFVKSDTKYTCPWKGDAVYYSLKIKGKIVKDAAWCYPDPKPAAKNIKGYYAFDRKLVEIEK